MFIRGIVAIGGAFLCFPTLASANESPAGPPIFRQASDVGLQVSDETLQRQYLALSAMPSVKVAYSSLGPVRLVEGATGVVLSSPTRNLSGGEVAYEVLQKFKDVLLASGTETLTVRLNRVSRTLRHRTLKLDQSIDGIPVLYGSVSLRIEEATGLVESLGARFLPDHGLPRQAKISSADAAERAARYLVERDEAMAGSVETSTPALAYHGTFPGSTRVRLVWVVPARYTPMSRSNGRFEDVFYWIDAINGDFVGSDAAAKNALKVYTANNAAPASGSFPSGLQLLFTHPGSSGDQIAMNAYNNLLDTIVALEVVTFWLAGPLGPIVHYDTNWDGATYNRVGGVDYLRFGDGKPALFSGPFGNSRDVVAHEFGHGVVRVLVDPFGGELSDAQSGAIEEGFGDVTAAVVDTYNRPGVAAATWTIGEVWTNDPNRGIRSLSNPKSTGLSPSPRDWFPARLLGTDKQTRHANSTIMGHAFKLLVTGGFHAREGQAVGDGFTGQIPSLFVPALGHEKTWAIFFESFNDPALTSFLNFDDLKAAAVATADSLYGPFESDAVDRAFRAVGVGHGCSAPPSPPVLTAIDLCQKWRLNWPAVLGATGYHGQRKPTAWGWVNAFTIVDGNADHCIQQVPELTDARLRACNGCGCSDWSNTVQMWKWAQCP